MALPKHFRVHRQVPSFYMMATGTVLIAFFLITFWMLVPSSQVASTDSDLVKTGLTIERREKVTPKIQPSETQSQGVDDTHIDSDNATDKENAGNSSSQEGSRVNDSSDEESGQQNNPVMDTKEASQDDKVDKAKGEVEDGKKEQILQPVKNIEGDKLPEATTAAQSELTTENKETPKNWTTQVVESTKEKELVQSQNGDSPGTEKKGSQSAEKQNNGNHQDFKEGGGGKEQVQPQDEQETEQQFVEERQGGSVEEKKVEQQDIVKQLTGESNGSSQVPLPGGEGKAEGRESFNWTICKWKGATDYIPCLDNTAYIKKLPSTRRFQHRERHCPSMKDFPLCLLPLPDGYKVPPIRWPRSRDEIWFRNVPYPKLASYKKDQNWMMISEDKDKLLFPGGGTQFKDGASEYINRIERDLPDVAWGKHTRVVLDVGCGVASFGGYLFEKDVLTMSFAPKDEHEAQVQLALERGIPAISAVMGTERLVFPSNVYDLVHCARCRVHWQGDDGMLLIEVNRVLRPGGYFVWSATPVYRKTPEDIKFWNDVVVFADSMCWKLMSKTWVPESGIGVAIFQKPTSNSCYEGRVKDYPPICGKDDIPDAAWYVPMRNCIYKIPIGDGVRAAHWPSNWPERLDSTMSWLNNSGKSLFGKPAAVEFQIDTEHWKHVVDKSYLNGLGIDWAGIRNVMDMKAGYGGFAAALIKQQLWVLNIVPVDEPDTLPSIFDRGLFGIYHDWCESFSTYPRTYDLLHVDHLFKRLISRCDPMFTLLEMDRILRPEGWIIFRERSGTLQQIDPIIKSLHWDVHLTYIDGDEELMVVRKSLWRPEVSEVA